MTQDNIFREVEEDIERQKYEDLWKRYGIYVVAAVLALVLGTGANSYWQMHTEIEHQKATGGLAVIQNQLKKDSGKGFEALQDFAVKNRGQAQAAIAELGAAALAAQHGNKDQAIKMYDQLAADPQADHAFRQLADLLSVQQQIDVGDVTVLQKRLQPLMAEKEPWRFSAMEYGGYLAIRAGDKAKATEIFTALSQDAGVPASLSARAADMLRLLAE